MNDLKKAKDILDSGSHTCVLCRGETVYTSDKKGIAPMVEFISEGLDLRGFSVADKIVGKAAALLFVYAGIESAYGEVMSGEGRDTLISRGVSAEFSTLTDKIINRQGTDICPMEKTVRDIDEPEKALEAIKITIEKLRNGEHI